MQIFLLRHGRAESQSASGADDERKLTDEGKLGIVQTAETLKSRGERIQKIFTSPYVRAQETAELVQKILRCGEGIEELPHLSSGVETGQMIEAVKAEMAGLESFMLVGHMPDLARLAAVLLGKNAPESIALRPGGLIKIELKSWQEPFEGTLIYAIG